MLAIFYIVTTPLQDTRGVPEVGPGSLTSGDRWSDMIPTCHRYLRLLGGPGPVGMRGHAQHVQVAVADLEHEQHVEPATSSWTSAKAPPGARGHRITRADQLLPTLADALAADGHTSSPARSTTPRTSA